MICYQVDCPYCGQRNAEVYLDETNGLFECERCGLVTRLTVQESGPFRSGSQEGQTGSRSARRGVRGGYGRKRAV